VQNLEPELMFGAKPRAGAHSGSAEQSMPYAVWSKAQVSKSMVFTVFLHVRRRSRAKSDFWGLSVFQPKLLAHPDTLLIHIHIYIYIYMYIEHNNLNNRDPTKKPHRIASWAPITFIAVKMN